MRCRVLLLPLVMFGCATKVYKDDYGPFQPAAVVADSAVYQFFTTLQRDLPNECVLCLYGRTVGDTVQVAFIRPAQLDSATDRMAHYRPCPRPNPDVFGALRYLGTAHNHPPASGGPCAFSGPDSKSFYNDQHAIIDAVMCNGRLIWRAK